MAAKLSVFFTQCYTCPENFVAMTTITFDLWLLFQDMSGQKGESKFALCRHGYSFVSIQPKTSSWSYLRPMVVVQVQFGSVTFGLGHFRSYKVISLICLQFLTEARWGKRMISSCSVVKTHQLMRMLTSFGHQLSLRLCDLTWGQIRLKFDVIFWGQQIHVPMAFELLL